MSVAEYFEYKEVAGAEMAQFRVKGTKFDGVVFSFGQVTPVEDKKNKRLKLNFKVKFFNIPKEHTEDKLLKNKAFNSLLGQFLAEQIELYLAQGDKPKDVPNK